jgi:predicted MFS family arabinose efflux permease
MAQSQVMKEKVPELAALQSPTSDPSGAKSYGSTKPATQSDNDDLRLLKLGLAAKLVYFLRFAQQGVFYTYIALYLNLELGISVIGCSVAFLVMMIGQTIGSNTIPVLADASHWHTSIATLSHLIGSALALTLLYLTKGSLVEACVILGVANIFIGGCMPLSDAAVFRMCKKHSFNFGTQRLWGALGWGIFATLVAVLISGNNVKVMWYVYAAIAPFTVIAIYCLLSMTHVPVAPPLSGGAVATEASPQDRDLTTVWKFLFDPVVPPFLLSVALLGGLFGSVSVLYMGLWAVEDLHASYLVLGVSALVMNLCEIPMFFYAADFGKYLGVHGVLYISVFAYAFWLLSYGYLVTNAWWIVAFQPLHGLAFAMQIGNLGTFTTKLADKIGFASSSAQGFKQGALNFGRAVGFICAGVLYEVYSATFMFRVMGFCSVFMLLSVVWLHAMARYSGNTKTLYLD